jgi:hypothetical protein
MRQHVIDDTGPVLWYPATIEVRWDTVEGLNRRVSFLHRTYNLR